MGVDSRAALRGMALDGFFTDPFKVCFWGGGGTVGTGDPVAASSVTLDYIPIEYPAATLPATIEITPSRIFDEAIRAYWAIQPIDCREHACFNPSKSSSEFFRVARRSVVLCYVNGSR